MYPFYRNIEAIPGVEVVIEKNIISDCVLQAQVKLKFFFQPPSSISPHSSPSTQCDIHHPQVYRVFYGDPWYFLCRWPECFHGKTGACFKSFKFAFMELLTVDLYILELQDEGLGDTKLGNVACVPVYISCTIGMKRVHYNHLAIL